MSAEFIFAAQPRAFARQEGISIDELKDMVRRSAKASFSNGNRRFHQFVFRVEDALVTFAGKLSTQEGPPQRELQPGEFWVLEDGRSWVLRKDAAPLFKSGRNDAR